MSAGRWAVVIVAALALVGLLVFGDEDRLASGRGREGAQERSSQALLAAPVGVGSGLTITITAENPSVPPDVKGSLEQVEQLLADAEDQPAEQARATLEEAQDLLEGAIDSIRDAAADTSNDAARARLLALANTLDRVERAIQLRIDQL